MEDHMENSMLDKQSEITKKAVYIKPSINRIKLVASEAVLALCKLGTGAGVSVDCEPDLLCVADARS